MAFVPNPDPFVLVVPHLVLPVNIRLAYHSHIDSADLIESFSLEDHRELIEAAYAELYAKDLCYELMSEAEFHEWLKTEM